MVHLPQILLLLGVAVAVVLTFQRLHIPTSLGYLLVGVILGPHTIGPTVNVPEFKTMAEFGVVFLLFTMLTVVTLVVVMLRPASHAGARGS